MMVSPANFIMGSYGSVIPIPVDSQNIDWLDTSFGFKVPKYKLSSEGKLKLAIMGGTFDPCHFGHLVTAQAALDLFQLDGVVFVPAGLPPHKRQQRISPSSDRYHLTELAILSNPKFYISDLEVKRKGYSFAINTVDNFYQIYGKELELYFITGADAILEIMTWHQVDELVKRCQFIAATRPGYDKAELVSALKELPQFFQNRIHMIEVPALAISSTDIRKRVAERQPIRYLLPEPVERYILERGLYASE